MTLEKYHQKEDIKHKYISTLDLKRKITMGDVDRNVYNNFNQLKKQITRGQLVVNDADPYSARFIELVKAGQDDEAIKLLKSVTKMSQ